MRGRSLTGQSVHIVMYALPAQRFSGSGTLCSIRDILGMLNVNGQLRWHALITITPPTHTWSGQTPVLSVFALSIGDVRSVVIL